VPLGGCASPAGPDGSKHGILPLHNERNTVLTENNVTKAETLFPADPVVTASARKKVDEAINRKMPLISSAITRVIIGVQRRVYAACIPTMQVQLAHDKLPVLGIGPEFADSLDDISGIVFVLSHEAMHLVARHLYIEDPVKRVDPRYTEVIEAWINFFVMGMLKQSLPTINGEPTGVDPVKLFEWFKRSASEAGLTDYPRRIEEFYQNSDFAYQWICKLPKQRRSKDESFCNHDLGDPSQSSGGSGDQSADGQGSGSMKPVLDEQAVGELVEKAIEVAVTEVLQSNNKAAREELEKLMGATVGNEKAEKIFGSMGAYELLGKTAPEKRTRFWDKKVARAIASLIKPGEKLAFNRKRPKERIFSPRGKVEEKSIVIAIDTSGSMFYGDAIQKVRELIGQTKAKARWVWFDGSVWEFEPGDDLRGGGGTDCSKVEEWIQENCKRYPDAVICVTDGIFQHFTPAKPKRWVWVITRDGDDWPKNHEPRMKVTKLPF